jgi:Cu(I)/Ag(I) efflux system membrane fusion protein
MSPASTPVRTAAAILALVALAAAGGAVGCRRETTPAGRSAAAAAKAPRYQCPMHPQITSDEPGRCPICGMDLVKVEAEALPAPEAATPDVAGRAAVTLSTERRQLLGVRGEPVHHARLERTIRTVGRVAADERRVHHVHAKVEGYVERLDVDFVGALVRKGQRLLSIYSPELVATQQEYLLAYRARQRLAQSPVETTARSGDDLLEAARQRLLFWDVRPADIAELERSGQVRRTVDLYADHGGFVTQKTVVVGMRVMPSDTLFDIVDLSHLWVMADVYESDLPLIRPGMTGDVTLPYLPGRSWTGAVTNVAPTVDPATRTVKVRLEVGNPGSDLKPDMYADVVLRPSLGTGLIVPESAVIQTGNRSIVFVELGEGRYEPREVQLGPKVEGGVQVIAGLEDAESVVVSANFLLDSESSLKAALGAVRPLPSAGPAAGGSPGAAAPPAADPYAGHRH